jgi:hypothetical protein
MPVAPNSLTTTAVPLALRRIKEALEKRCLSRTEKAGEHNDRDTRSAFALESAAETPGGG